MPTYDFVCNACQKRFEVFLTYSQYGKTPVHCAHCQSENVRRRMTKVRIAKSDDSRMASMADGLSNLENVEHDPQALAQMMKRMGSEMGEDLPAEFDEVVDRLEAGQSPNEIETALPDLGADTTSSDE